MKSLPIVFAASIVFILAPLLSGCSTATPSGGLESADLVGLVVGDTAYAPQVTTVSLTSVLEQTVSDGTIVEMYSTDGTPRPLWSGPVSWDESAQQSGTSRTRAFTKVANAALGAQATTAESNPLEAVLQIAGSFSAFKGRKEIVILDPLLQTAGALPLQDGVLGGEPSDAVTALRASGYLTTDLKGIHIVLTDAGQVAAGTKQPAMDSLSRKKLIAFWTYLFRAAGASVSTTSLQFGGTRAATQTVTVIPLTPINPVVANCTVSLDGAALGFQPNTAVFTSRSASLATISAAAQRLKAAGCTGKVTLIGTTSSAGTAASRQHVATIRVLAVRGLLATELGVTETSIQTNPVGYDTRYCAKDTDAQGHLLAGPASRCRLVVISVGS